MSFNPVFFFFHYLPLDDMTNLLISSSNFIIIFHFPSLHLLWSVSRGICLIFMFQPTGSFDPNYHIFKF